MTTTPSRIVPVLFAEVILVCACSSSDARHAGPTDDAPPPEETMLVQYLEIVTTDMDATCNALATMHGVVFGEPEPGLGNARTAALEGGGRIGVRAPIGEHEQPVVRPYVLVKDIEAAVGAAEAAGAEILMPSTAIPGHGKFAIYRLGGIEHALWQL